MIKYTKKCYYENYKLNSKINWGLRIQLQTKIETGVTLSWKKRYYTIQNSRDVEKLKSFFISGPLRIVWKVTANHNPSSIPFTKQELLEICGHINN